MRVVAGSAKGRELRPPKSSRTRPTSDKVRDAIFNVLGPEIDGAVVLDLYAGSGAMGIEALSRGAERVEMVESDRDACQTIKRNLDLTGFGDLVTLWPMPVEKALGRLGTSFDIIIADPPYADPAIHDLMSNLGSGELVLDHGVVALEHGKRFAAAETYGTLIRRQEKRYGDTAVSFYARGDADV